MGEVLSFWDFILTPMYMLIIYLIAYQIKAKQIIKHPEYKYFVKGLTFKIFGGIAFALVYVFWYNGGDTHTYFLDSIVIVKMLFHKPLIAFSILANNLSMENYAHFDYTTLWPHLYVWRDPNTFTVVRYSVILTLLGANTYIPSTILVSCLSYLGVWKLFQLFNKLYSTHTKYLAIAILFMPSFVFWGSGIMKDTYIIGATCWITYNFYQIFISNKKISINIFLFIINFIIILNIKPYVMGCLIPSMLLWLNQAYIQKIKSTFFKSIVFPFIILTIGFSGSYIFSEVSKSMGDYSSVDNVIDKARVTQQDLLRESQYGSNSYDLGEINGSTLGILRIAPLAIFTTLYRPFVTEIGNPLMALSALENLSLLIFTLIIILKTSPVRMLNILRQNPILQYSLIFSIMLAFGVGLATANFGALVRYKIPLVPFYFSTLFLIYQISEKEKIRRKSYKKY
ncbi:hypothetical protein N9242_05425 [Vicingaceae bacterium]|nr:hypothetical protein [Vicingaceae bacterium]